MNHKKAILTVVITTLLTSVFALPPTQAGTWELQAGVELAPSEHTSTTYMVDEPMSVRSLEVESDGIRFNGEKFKAYGEGNVEIGFREWTDKYREFTANSSGDVTFDFSGFDNQTLYSIECDDEVVHISSGENFTYIHTQWSTHTFTVEEAGLVETLKVEDIDRNSARLYGEVTNLDVDEAQVYFEFRKEGSENWATTEKEDIYAEDKFSIYADGLDSVTKYEFRGVIEYDYEGEEYDNRGGIKSFETISLKEQIKRDATHPIILLIPIIVAVFVVVYVFKFMGDVKNEL